MRTAAAAGTVALPPGGVLRLWTDVTRWPALVEGFERTLELSSEWPEPGAKVVWESGAGGRGRVTERVVSRDDARLATEIFEAALHGTQTLSVRPAPEGGTLCELRLDYELERYGPLRAVADALFIRRALRDSLRRTLRRLAVEAEEEAGLRG